MVKEKLIDFKMDSVYRLSKICGDEFKTNPIEMQSKTRVQHVVFARHIAMHILRNKYRMSYYFIGFTFNRTHATVINAVKSVDNMLATDRYFREKFQIISEKENG
jgi:chromosomal replication initiator protein